MFMITRTHPLPSLRSGFPLSAGAKRGNVLVYSGLLPLLCDSREGGRGDEYVFSFIKHIIPKRIPELFFQSWFCSLQIGTI